METQKYFKLLNEKEIHNNFQFKDGLNIDPIPFNSNEDEKCVPGGIYFSKAEDILKWLQYRHHWVREVTILENAQVVEFKNKLRADKIILEPRMSLSNASTWKYLDEHGADIHADGDYSLRLAAYNGHLGVVKFLVQHGANIHTDKDCAVRWSAEKGHLEVVRYLVEQGADIHAENDYALRWAADNGHGDTVNYLKSL